MTFVFPDGDPPFDARWYRKLVDAVFAASESDEGVQIEWKEQLDLSGNEGCANVARQINAFANRATSTGEPAHGHAFLVAGAEPGAIHGITTDDPANYCQRIDNFLGQDGPTWHPHIVQVGEVPVLIVDVPPPLDGDPMWVIRKDGARINDGNVFVRRHGRSDQAKSSDIERLLQRSQRRHRVEGLDISAQGLAARIDMQRLRSEIEQWVEKAVQRRFDESKPRSVHDSMNAYKRELDTWRSSASSITLDAILYEVLGQTGGVRFTAADTDLRSRSGAEIRIAIEGEAQMRELPLGEAPSFPRPPKVPSPMSLLFDSVTAAPSAAHLFATPVPWDPSVSVDPGEKTALVSLGEIRPGTAQSSPPFLVLVPDFVETEVVDLSWSCTVGGEDGLSSGAATIDVLDMTDLTGPDLLNKWWR